jgi:hypothetical protein
MKRTFSALFTALLAGAAAAQSQEASTKKETRPLNLKLDDAEVRRAVTFAPREGAQQGAGDGLPALGENARTLERPSTPAPSRPSSPFPKDTETAR